MSAAACLEHIHCLMLSWLVAAHRPCNRIQTSRACHFTKSTFLVQPPRMQAAQIESIFNACQHWYHFKIQQCLLLGVLSSVNKLVGPYIFVYTVCL